MMDFYYVVAVKVVGEKRREVDCRVCFGSGIGSCANAMVRRALKRYKLPVYDLREPRKGKRFFDNLPCDHVVVVSRPLLV